MSNGKWLDKLIDECIDNVASDDINSGAESLFELAGVWAKAGMPLTSFQDMRKFIIDQAKERTDSHFIDTKLKLAERKAQNERNNITGQKIITTVQ